jgi:thiol:disulfide interchange protein/DsbC/DsbD-like thiol-disulfide interchange protein
MIFRHYQRSLSSPLGRFSSLLSTVIALAIVVCPSWTFALVEHDWMATTERSEVSLIAEYSVVTPHNLGRIGLRFKLKPGWHIYFSNPGDSGMSPRLVAAADNDSELGPIQWPNPEIIPVGPLFNYGYHDDVLLPLSIDSARIGSKKRITVSVKASWLVCQEDCVPESARLRLSLPLGDQTVLSPDISLFKDFDRQAPRALGTTTPIIYEQSENALSFTVPVSPQPLIESYFFPARQGISNAHATQQSEIKDDVGIRLSLTPASSFSREKTPHAIGLLKIVRGRDLEEWYRIGDYRDFVMPQGELDSRKSSEDNEPRSLLPLLLLAFISGILLNGMPCVLPVLSLKVLWLLGQCEQARFKKLLLTGLYVLGVIASMLLLAAIIIALRTQGNDVGWGFHLQYPPVVGVLAIFFAVYAFSFLDFFSVGNSISRHATRLDTRDGYSGAFLSGVLTTVVATPCTAPFLGGALSYALSKDALTTTLLFSALGLGIAAPFCALMLLPSAHKLLPRPGAWMITAKRVLSIPLLATSAWLLWVLTTQRDLGYAIITGVVALCAGVLLWSQAKRQSSSSAPPHALPLYASIGLIVLLIGYLGSHEFAYVHHRSTVRADGLIHDGYGLHWKPYNPEQVQQSLAEGKIVYIDFTAAWCVTCQLNKRLSLSDARIAAILQGPDFVLYQGDWTEQDPVVSAGLAQYGRASVPLNVVLSPTLKEPIILPTILTPSALLDGLERAQKPEERLASDS